MLEVRIEGESRPLTLADELASGTDGAVYSHPDQPGKLIKLWHEPIDGPLRLDDIICHESLGGLLRHYERRAA